MESVLNSYHPPIDWSEGYSPHSQTNSRIDETGWPLSPRSPSHTNSHLPESKRDKKRRETSDRLTALNTEFLLSREQNFRATLQKLQAELTALHEGGNREFLDRVEVLEDARDKELVQIEAGRGYALLRAEREYQDEMRRAEEEYVVWPSFPPTFSEQCLMRLGAKTSCKGKFVAGINGETKTT